jgi:hypothetical protein
MDKTKRKQTWRFYVQIWRVRRKFLEGKGKKGGKNGWYSHIWDPLTTHAI